MTLKLPEWEPLRSLVKGIAEAAGMFASLDPDQLDSLPDAALLGIARLRGTVAEFTGAEASPVPVRDFTADWPVVIEWAPPADAHCALLGCLTSVSDALTGEQITTVTGAQIIVDVDAAGLVTADLTMFADEDGNPLPAGLPLLRGGQELTGVFRVYVSEMRVRAE